jgi:hypothetical protein
LENGENGERNIDFEGGLEGAAIFEDIAKSAAND